MKDERLECQKWAPETVCWFDLIDPDPLILRQIYPTGLIMCICMPVCVFYFFFTSVFVRIIVLYREQPQNVFMPQKVSTSVTYISRANAASITMPYDFLTLWHECS